MSKPSIKEFMDATGSDFQTASDLLYGNVGANIDARDWNAIMSSNDAVQAAKSGLAAMYSDPAYQAQNTANLAAQGYSPAQAYYTYGQMNDRVGANYTPSQSEVAAVENYFKDLGSPIKWSVSAGGNTNAGSGGATSTNTSAASTNAVGGLTPSIAQNLMQRSMTTGVPTSEFNKYGGYDAVKAMYDANKGAYSLDEMDPGFLDQMDDIIANTGVGNLSLLQKTGTPLTEAGRQAMINNGISWTNDDLKAMNIPYVGFLQKPVKKAAALTNTADNTNQLAGGGADLSQGAGGAGGGGWGPSTTVWSSDNRLMGAGNADYNSSLIKSLRQASMTPFSNNAGIQMYANPGAATSSWTAPNMADAAFSPSVLSPRMASDQEVSDWNAYQAYKTNSVGAKTPILSMEEWIAKGRSDGKPVAQTPAPDYDANLYSA